MSTLNEPPFLCVDRVPELVWTDRVDEVAIEANPENRRTTRTPEGLEAAGVTALFWKPGTALRVCFLDGDESLRQQVLAAARSWTEHANLGFVVVDSPSAEIRVTFTGAGNWSAIGTTALVPEVFPPDRPTMCLSEAPRATPSRLLRIARHEFGHAIGLVHEHSSPSTGMRWNKPEVYRVLGGPPHNWDVATVEANVFLRYAETTTQFTSFDPSSVMLYSFPPTWTLDNITYPENRELSATDKAFVRDVYPGR